MSAVILPGEPYRGANFREGGVSIGERRRRINDEAKLKKEEEVE